MRALASNPGLNSKGKLFDTFCFPDFPGLDKSFRVTFDTDQRIQRSIPLDYFKNAVTSNNPATRLREVVTLVTKELGALATVEPNPDVVVIVMPPEVEEACKTIGAEFAAMKIRLTPVQKIQRKFEKVRADRTGTSGVNLRRAGYARRSDWLLEHSPCLKGACDEFWSHDSSRMGKHAPRAKW